jgi:uncharacterized protein (DUF1501 family)
MSALTRRGLLAGTAAAGSLAALPGLVVATIASETKTGRVLDGSLSIVVCCGGSKIAIIYLSDRG